MIFYIDKATQKIHEGTYKYADSLRNSNIVFFGDFPIANMRFHLLKSKDIKK